MEFAQLQRIDVCCNYHHQHQQQQQLQPLIIIQTKTCSCNLTCKACLQELVVYELCIFISHCCSEQYNDGWLANTHLLDPHFGQVDNVAIAYSG